MPTPQGITWMSRSPSFGFPFGRANPKYLPPDHPGGAGSCTIGRTPIECTKALRFPFFFVCSVPSNPAPLRVKPSICVHITCRLHALLCTHCVHLCVCMFPSDTPFLACEMGCRETHLKAETDNQSSSLLSKRLDDKPATTKPKGLGV